MFGWKKLGPPIVPDAVLAKMARAIGFMPLMMYGLWGTSLTFPVPVHMVIAKAIELPKVEDPTQEQIEMYLQRFIDSIRRIFDAYKERTGHASTELLIL